MYLGPPRLPIWGTYAISLLLNWNFPHFPFQNWAKKYGNIFGMYFGSLPCVVTCDYETCKEVLNRVEFDGKPDLVAARLRNINQKQLGIFYRIILTLNINEFICRYIFCGRPILA